MRSVLALTLASMMVCTSTPLASAIWARVWTVFEGGTQLVDVDAEQVGRCLGPLGPALASSAAFAVGACVSWLFDRRIDRDGVIDLGAYDGGADEASCDESGADETGANALVHDVLSFKGILGDSSSG